MEPLGYIATAQTQGWARRSGRQVCEGCRCPDISRTWAAPTIAEQVLARQEVVEEWRQVCCNYKIRKATQGLFWGGFRV